MCGVAEPEGKRYDVQPGPPTWVIYDLQAGRVVFPKCYPDKEEADRLAAQLNRTHADYRTDY